MKSRTVKEYLSDLEEGKEERPEQVRDGLEIFIELWKKAIERGILRTTDSVEEALAKLDEAGGLYNAAGE